MNQYAKALDEELDAATAYTRLANNIPLGDYAVDEITNKSELAYMIVETDNVYRIIPQNVFEEHWKKPMEAFLAKSITKDSLIWGHLENMEGR